MSWRLVRFLAASVVALATTASINSCSSANDAESASDLGGQTGSLVPPACRFDRSVEVPEGDVAFVVDAVECPELVQGTVLVGGDGHVVGLYFEPLEGSTSVVRSDVALTEGDYYVVAPGEDPASAKTSDRALAVMDAAPLPSRLGEVTYSGTCALTLLIEPDPAVLPYLDLLRIEASIGAEESRVLADFGELGLEDGLVVLPLGQCGADFPCPTSDLQVFLEAVVAGEQLSLEPATVSVSTQCSADEDEPQACSVDAGERAPPPSSLWGFVLAALVLRRRVLNRPSPDAKARHPQKPGIRDE